jgi:hypothetical protein
MRQVHCGIRCARKGSLDPSVSQRSGSGFRPIRGRPDVKLYIYTLLVLSTQRSISSVYTHRAWRRIKTRFTRERDIVMS